MSLLRKNELKVHLKSLGWRNVDLAARWGMSETWVSLMLNHPDRRTLIFEDAVRGLPPRDSVEIKREPRHGKRSRRREPVPWTPEELFPAGRIWEAIDSAVMDEGQRVVVMTHHPGPEGELGSVDLQAVLEDGSLDEPFNLPCEALSLHFCDLGLVHAHAT